MDFVHFCEDAKTCATSEWTRCGAYYCPYGAAEHFWHDGCPACEVDFIVEDAHSQPPSLMDQMLISAGIPIPDAWFI